MTAQKTTFQSCQPRGIDLGGGEHISFGLPVVLGFTLLPQPPLATVLPTRYTLASARISARWQGRQAAWLEKEAMSLFPVFRLGRACSKRLTRMPYPAASAASALQQLRSVATQAPTASHDSVSTNLAASTSAAAASAAVAPAGSTFNNQSLRHQSERQYHAAAIDDTQSNQQPWLGAQLDIAGYTKKGYMRGGGKEQNQDRGLIMQQFRSPHELLIGVMDGHGTFGHLVSTYLIQHLPAVLMQKLVAATAALQPATCSSSGADRGSSSHTAQQQQQQQALQYVVMPDHSGSSNGSSLAMDLHEQQQQQQSQVHKRGAPLRRGRSVTKHKVVHQPMHMHSDSSSNEKNYHTVPTNLISHTPLSKGLLAAVFADTDHMLVNSGINVLDSGSTALVTHIGHDILTTAWVGDSRAILGRRLVDPEKGLRGCKQQQQQVWQQWDGGGSSSNGSSSSSSSSQKWQVIQLSDDHKPERPDEQLRIVMNNGRVEQMKNAAGQGVGPHRVWFKNLDYPGLAMSRAFGDAPCRRIGVTVEPQLYVHRLTEADQVLVAATDGVWEYMTNQEVVELVGRCASAAAAAQKLVEAAEERWQEQERGAYIDDITAVVVMATPQQQTKAAMVSKL